MLCICRSAIISQQSEKPSEEILAVYGKLVGVQTSHLSKDIGEVDFSNGKRIFAYHKSVQSLIRLTNISRFDNDCSE